MKFSEPLESQRLSFLLEKAASREAKMWKAYVPKKPSAQDADVSPDQRDEAVCWLTELHGTLHLYPETLSLAISILDRFLSCVKARPKYLRCIAVTCFFLAAKTSEEDECVPMLRDLASASGCGCSASEILRMERIVLDKLDWDLHAATPLEFLQIFHAMALSCRSPSLLVLPALEPSRRLARLTQQLHLCLGDHALLCAPGSMLALALITLELETLRPDWLIPTVDLLRKAQIDSSQLIGCRELVARRLSTYQASLPPNTVYIYRPLRHSLAPCARGGGPVTSSPTSSRPPPAPVPAGEPPTLLAPPKLRPQHQPRPQEVHLCYKHSAKRKVDEMEVDEFFDGIKRLYNEESVQEGAAGAAAGEGQGVGCSVLRFRQEGSISPCPPLQPVSAT